MIINNDKQEKIEQLRAYFSYSPSLELVMCLHVMSNPSHHGDAGEWAMQQYKSLPKDLRNEIEYFGYNYAEWSFIADVFSDISHAAYPRRISISEATEKLKKMPKRKFAYLFLGLSAFKYDIATLDKWLLNPESVSEMELGVQGNFLTVDAVQYFLNNIEKVRARIIWTINEFWDKCFRTQWEKINAIVAEKIERESARFERTDKMDYMRGLHPKLIVSDNEIIFSKDPNYSMPIVDLHRLIIQPSIFCEPHLCGNIFGNSMNIMLSLSFGEVMPKHESNEDITELFYILSDYSRMQIMKILWNKETTTKELAEELDLSQSTVSTHLKLLRDKELVDMRKDRKYVFYCLRKEPFLAIGKELVRFFES